jgi:hypothetical protein
VGIPKSRKSVSLYNNGYCHTALFSGEMTDENLKYVIWAKMWNTAFDEEKKACN